VISLAARPFSLALPSRRMTDSLESLAAVPIGDLLAAANEMLQRATVDELATIFADGTRMARLRISRS
jgi:hypothetical protein